MIYALIIALVVIFDQVTKYFASTVLTQLPNQSATFIPGFMEFTYVENTGAAFSIFSNATWLLTVISFVMAVVVIFLLFKYRNKFSWLFRLALCFIAGGAIGNLIDRLFLGYVVDMLQFSFVNFAVFNVADAFLTFGAIMLGVFIIWFWDKDKKEKNAEV